MMRLLQPSEMVWIAVIAMVGAVSVGIILVVVSSSPVNKDSSLVGLIPIFYAAAYVVAMVREAGLR